MVEINANPSNQIKLSPQDQEFINRLSNNITMYGQIPYNVPKQLYIDTIIQSAKWFYKYYWLATYKTYYYVQKSDVKSLVNTLDFAKFRSVGIKMPPFISNIREIFEVGKNNDMTSMVLMENIQWSIQHNSAMGQSLLGINSNMFILEAACKMVEETAFDSVMGESIPFDYNPLTKQLFLFKDLRYNIMLEADAMVNVQVLYNDNYFERHVLAQVKRQLKRQLAGHTFELPGGVTVTADEICNNIEDAEKVEDIVKNGSGVGDLIFTRG